jgi:hypothetical protein
MDATNPTSPTPSEMAETGTKDGQTAADNDQPYKFGQRATSKSPYPFNERQFARLLIMRSRLQETPSAEDCAAA